MALTGLVTRKDMGWGPTPAPVTNTTLGMIAHYDGNKGLLSEWRRLGHTACVSYWRKTRTGHMSGNGWKDIGYAYFVCPDDKIFEGRTYGHQQAAEAPTAGKLQNGNSRYISVTFGLGPDEKPTDGQLRAWHRLRSWYVNEKGGKTAVYGHRDFTSTSCPGDELYGLVRDGTLKNSSTTPSKPPTTPAPSKPVPVPPPSEETSVMYASFGSSSAGSTTVEPGTWTDVLFDTEYADPTDVHPSGANPSILKGKPYVYSLEFGAEIVGASVGTVFDVDAAEYEYDGSVKPAVDRLKETGKSTSGVLTDTLTVHHSAVGWVQKNRKLRIRVRSHATVPVRVVNARVSVAFFD